MKKNGFIAMSLIYTFFIVFIVILLSIITFYLENNEVMRKLSKEITTKYNEGKEGKRVVDLMSRGRVKRGDYISYQSYNKNYASGSWFILKSDTTGVYLLSGFLMGYIQASEYNINNIKTLYRDKIINPELAIDDMFLLTESDLWASAGKTQAQSTHIEYNMWNIGAQYFVINNSNMIRIVAPNCSCSGTMNGGEHTSYFANTKPHFTTLSQWYSASGHCLSYANLVSKSYLSCPIRYILESSESETTKVVEDSYLSGVRVIIKLKPETILLGGTGSVGTPYRVGVK